MAILFRLMPLMARSGRTAEQHKKDLIEDFKQNRAGDAVRVCAEYLDYTAADRTFAAELAASGSPVWVVHAEKKGTAASPTLNSSSYAPAARRS
jgi:hypothetical protein